jgi:hypothetical protein
MATAGLCLIAPDRLTNAVRRGIHSGRRGHPRLQYLNPPAHALVLCVDEKSQIQALERTQPILPLGLGYVEDVSRMIISGMARLRCLRPWMGPTGKSSRNANRATGTRNF